ncbi:MAG: nucleotide sugar dehydrogenase [Candidatus Coatesbacteria bacterium]|nr:nucleotide sugar dehydrogenase [Candidatus Coatesbacteria bacterium]
MIDEFCDKIQKKDFILGVIGLGYVGLPLIMEFAKAGIKVYGFDIDEKKVRKLEKGESYIHHIPAQKIREYVSVKSFIPSSDFSKINETDVIIICVPTPLTKHREPDLTFIEKTAETISIYLRKGQLVILESTTYPGTTEELLVPILSKGSGLKSPEDFGVAFSPEREDPGRVDFTTSTIPKIVGGINSEWTEVASMIYGCAINNVVKVSSPKVAEMTKLLENIYRSVNIALVNELKVLLDKMGINIWEVIKAANTKPFGFSPFYPGPGLGGHCIPIDPFYLTWKAREYGHNTRFIELAGEINTKMPEYVIGRIIKGLSRQGKAIKNAKVLVLGVAYKKNIDDMRESPSLTLIELLEEEGADVCYHDPFISRIYGLRSHHWEMDSVELEIEKIKEYDVILIATDHSNLPYEEIFYNSQLVVDTRGVYQDKEESERFLRA